MVNQRVLDYLFHDILSQDPEMTESHPFLRDRTRAVRQDFTMQHERGPSAIESHERIARYHILCLHVLREWENFSESQELEQLRKGELPTTNFVVYSADGMFVNSPPIIERVLR